MNNNICQFYVIFGNRNFVPPMNNNVYINASNIKEIKELQIKIIDAYKEKAKLGNKVGSEIIFIIPNEKYKQKTEEIIKQLKVNGKIQVMATKVETVKPVSEPVKPVQQNQPLEINEVPKKINEINTFPKEPPKKEIINSIKQEDVKKQELKQEEKQTVCQRIDNVYRGTVDSTTYTNFNKPKKNNNVAIIIFAISFIFFIVSLILLFFM